MGVPSSKKIGESANVVAKNEERHPTIARFAKHHNPLPTTQVSIYFSNVIIDEFKISYRNFCIVTDAI